MTESAHHCDVRYRWTGRSEHVFSKRKVIRNKRAGTKTVIQVCSYCGRFGQRTETRIKR